MRVLKRLAGWVLCNVMLQHTGAIVYVECERTGEPVIGYCRTCQRVVNVSRPSPQ